MSILDVLKDKEDVILGKGVSASVIKDAEKELKLAFSGDYKEYLLTVGLVMCNGHELTGLGKTERTNVIFVTSQMKKLLDNIPNDWYVLENENMDGAVIWQDAKGNVYFNKKKEYSSLLDFIIDL